MKITPRYYNFTDTVDLMDAQRFREFSVPTFNVFKYLMRRGLKTRDVTFDDRKALDYLLEHPMEYWEQHLTTVPKEWVKPVICALVLNKVQPEQIHNICDNGQTIHIVLHNGPFKSLLIVK